MRRRDLDEAMKDFIARGGKVTIIPPAAREESAHTMSAKGSTNYDLMSLGEGELLFGEARTRKKSSKKKPALTNDEFAGLVEASGLPSSIIEALKRSVKK